MQVVEEKKHSYQNGTEVPYLPWQRIPDTALLANPNSVLT
jgi:hypothetical protein